MIDHTQLCVAAEDHKATVAWYEEVLKTIGYEKLLEFGPNQESVGFGDCGMPHHQMHTDWWVVSGPGSPPKTHHAFRCKGVFVLPTYLTYPLQLGARLESKHAGCSQTKSYYLPTLSRSGICGCILRCGDSSWWEGQREAWGEEPLPCELLWGICD